MSDISIVLDAVDNASGVLDKIAGKTSALGGAAGSATPQVGGLGSKLGGLGSTLLGSLGPIAGFATLTGAVAGFVKVGKESISLAADAETANVKLAQSLLSSGRGAEISASEIGEFASALMPIVNIDDEKIKDAYAAIAGFQNLPTDKMEDIVKTAADMTAALGGDLVSNATMVAGVLETGLIPRTWRFDAALKAQIQSMIKAGDTSGALAIMLDELNRKYGGQAAAQVDTYTGSVKGLGIAWGEFLEIQGKAITDNTVIRGEINRLTAALQQSTREQDLLTKAKLYGIKVDATLIKGAFDMNGILAAQADLLARVTKADWDMADATNEGARALAKMATGTKDASVAITDYTEQVKFQLSYSKSYGDYLTTLAGLEGQMAVARLKGGDAVTELTKKIQDLKDENQETTNEMIVGWAEAAAAVNGTARDEMESILGLAGALGTMTDAEIAAALKAWELKLQIEAVMALPDEIRKKFIVDVEAFGLQAAFNLLAGMPELEPGEPIIPGGPTPMEASGGSFSGWAMVGDTPGGGRTPYTEWVYAPHGATVYNQAQMRGESAPPMASGGVVPPMGGDQLNSLLNDVRNILRTLPSELARSTRDAVQQIVL